MAAIGSTGSVTSTSVATTAGRELFLKRFVDFESEAPLKHSFIMTAVTGVLLAAAVGCGANSNEEQSRALVYQQRSDDAAKNGQYGVAGDNQRKAQDAHHDAVNKAIDEGKPLPPQPKFGDAPPPRPPSNP